MIAFLLILGVSFYAIATSLIQLVSEYLFETKIQVETGEVENLSFQLAPLLVQADADQLYETMVEAGRRLGGRLLVLDMDAKVQADSFSEFNGMRLSHPEVISILQGETVSYGFHYLPDPYGSYIRTQRTQLDFLHPAKSDNIWVGYFTSVLAVDGERMGILLYSVQVQDMVDSLLVIQDQMLITFFIVAIIVLLLSVFFSQIITKPIAALTAGIQRMAKGDLSSRVKVSGGGEMARLAETFNQMSEKLENLDGARNQFVSNASHELKTPLATIKILLESVLYQDDMDPETRKEFLTDINQEIDRLTFVISDLLTLVHIDSQKMKLRREDVRLSEAISATVRRLTPLAKERDQQIDVTIAEECVLFADSMKLQQVIYNLLENAIKYTPVKGKIKIDVTRDGRNAIMQVKDSGVGIPKSDLPHVFDRFYRVDKARSRATGGTGLGLSIVKQIVLLHGGTVTVKSEEGKGTTFTVELPLR